MRLLCLGVWSKTLYIWEFQKTVSQNCVANDCFSCTTSARTQDLFLLLSDFSTNFHPFAMRAFFITSIVSFLVLFLGIEKKKIIFSFFISFLFLLKFSFGFEIINPVLNGVILFRFFPNDFNHCFPP